MNINSGLLRSTPLSDKKAELYPVRVVVGSKVFKENLIIVKE